MRGGAKEPMKRLVIPWLVAGLSPGANLTPGRLVKIIAPYASTVSAMPPSGSKQAAMSLPSKPQPPSILAVQSVN